MVESVEHVDHGEHVFRRLSRSWPIEGSLPSVLHFLPRLPNKKDPNDLGDCDGLSVTRENHVPAASACIGGKGRVFDLARLNVGQISALRRPDSEEQLTVEVRDPADPGHALIPQQNNRRPRNEQKEWAMALRTISTVVRGLEQASM